MNLQNFRQNIRFLRRDCGALRFSIIANLCARRCASVSGRVLNEVGDPVVGITIAIQPYKVMGNRREQGFIELWQRQTDSEGRFSITNIMPAESVRFVVHPEQVEQGRPDGNRKSCLSKWVNSRFIRMTHPHFRWNAVFLGRQG